MEIKLKGKISDEKYEKLVEYVHSKSNRYIIVFTVNMILVGLVCSFLMTGISFNEILPNVSLINDDSNNPKLIQTKLTPEICKAGGFTINKETSINNLSTEYAIYCQPDKIKNFEGLIGVGTILGLIGSFILGDKFSPKNLIMALLLAMSATLFLIIFDFSRSIAFLYFGITLFSFFGIILGIHKVIFTNNTSLNHHRPYILALVSSTGFISLMLNLFLYTIVKDWFNVFILFIIICIIITLSVKNGVIDSARYFLMKDNFNLFKKSLVDIGNVNGRKTILIEEEIFKTINEGEKSNDEDNNLLLSNNTNNTNGSIPEESSIQNYNRNDSYGESLFCFYNSIISNKELLENLILFSLMQFFLPTAYSSSLFHLNKYIDSYLSLWYYSGLFEAFGRLLAAYLMSSNLQGIVLGRKISKYIFLGIIIVAFIVLKILDLDKVEHLFVYFLFFTKACIETVNFINLVHMLDSFPTFLTVRILSLLIFVSKISISIFPIFNDYMNYHVTYINVYYCVLAILINYMTRETYRHILKN